MKMYRYTSNITWAQLFKASLATVTYTDIFVEKMSKSFSHFLNKKYWRIFDINV